MNEWMHKRTNDRDRNEVPFIIARATPLKVRFQGTELGSLRTYASNFAKLQNSIAPA